MEYVDYNRTVVGYHGTRRSLALQLVQLAVPFDGSANPDDWLGRGIYFWEYAPRQAFRWAEQRRVSEGWDEPVAVVASSIRLGNCLDLLDPGNVEFMRGMYGRYVAKMDSLGLPPAVNRNASKRLDCAVFESAYDWHAEHFGSQIDTSRGVYVPTGSSSRAWPRSWISREAHIQLCVRNRACIMGTWLVDESKYREPR